MLAVDVRPSVSDRCMLNASTPVSSCMSVKRLLDDRRLTRDNGHTAERRVTMLLETAMEKQRPDKPPLVIFVDNNGHLYETDDCGQHFNSEVGLVSDYGQLTDTHTQTVGENHVDGTDEVSIVSVRQSITACLFFLGPVSLLYWRGWSLFIPFCRYFLFRLFLAFSLHFSSSY